LDIAIREMEKGDWSRVAEIYYQGILSDMATFETVLPSFEVWDRAHLRGCRLVAEGDRGVAGWAALLPYSDRACFKGVAELSVYVDVNHKRQGVGEALLRELCAESDKAGFWSLQSVIFQENLGSIALHEKCGFRSIGFRERLAKDRNGVWRNVVLMERRIRADNSGLPPSSLRA
jgi:phosphinothricin acetyltransferase